MFVDGENFTLRAQELARREGLTLSIDPARYLQDVFVWIPTWHPIRPPVGFPLERNRATRSYYYTSVTSDDPKIVEVRRRAAQGWRGCSLPCSCPRSSPSSRWLPCHQAKAGSRSILSTPSRGGENKTVCPFRRAWGRFWPFVRLAGTIPSIVGGTG